MHYLNHRLFAAISLLWLGFVPLSAQEVSIGKLEDALSDIEKAKAEIETKKQVFRKFLQGINAKEQEVSTLANRVKTLQSQLNRKAQDRKDLDARFRKASDQAADDPYYKPTADAIYEDLQTAISEHERINTDLLTAKSRHQAEISGLKQQNEQACPVQYRDLEQAYRTRAQKKFASVEIYLEEERTVTVEASRTCDEKPSLCREKLQQTGLACKDKQIAE